MAKTLNKKIKAGVKKTDIKFLQEPKELNKHELIRDIEISKRKIEEYIWSIC